MTADLRCRGFGTHAGGWDNAGCLVLVAFACCMRSCRLRRNMRRWYSTGQSSYRRTSDALPRRQPDLATSVLSWTLATCRRCLG